MKKAVSCIAVILMILTAAGCGTQSVPLANEADISTTAPPDANPTTPAAPDFLSLYAPVLEIYKDVLLHYDDGQLNGKPFVQEEPWVSFISMLQAFLDQLQELESEFGYALKDFNGDRIPELVLLSPDSLSVFALYSLVGNQPCLLAGLRRDDFGQSKCYFSKEGENIRLLIESNEKSIIYDISPDGSELIFYEIAGAYPPNLTEQEQFAYFQADPIHDVGLAFIPIELQRG